MFVMFLYCILYCNVFGKVTYFVYPLTLCSRILKYLGCGRPNFAEMMMMMIVIFIMIFHCMTSLTVVTATCIQKYRTFKYNCLCQEITMLYIFLGQRNTTS